MGEYLKSENTNMQNYMITHIYETWMWKHMRCKPSLSNKYM